MRAEEGGSELPLGAAQQRLVLGLLIAAGRRVVTTEQIMDRVWPGELPDQARKTIQVHVSRLRKALGGVIVSEGGGYRLGADVETDLADFERLAAEGRGLLADRPDRAGALFRQALELWRGAPFGDLAHEEGLLGEVSRLEELRLGVLEDRLDAEIAVGRTAVEELEDLMKQHPLRERLRALHMTALYRGGRQSEALASYRRFGEMLLETGGLDPSPELQDLELRILQHDPSLGPALPSPVTPVTANPPPARYASFVGREDETETLASALRSHRLVTVVGPGGIGKSSLATEVLGTVDGIPTARVAWADIETTMPGEVAQAAALAMGLQPFPTSDPEDVLIGFARERPHLLALDGCEPHVEETAGLVGRVLAACPEIRILATSREPLGLAGEHLLRLDSLDTAAAAELFIDRTGFEPGTIGPATKGQIDATCEALDGIPLAIELAAARLRAMSVDRFVAALDDQVELLQRLRGAEGRHASLTAALEASYRLLDEDQQGAFRRLSVFRQRFEAGAAASVADAEAADRIIDRLVEVSLIQAPDPDGSHRMLEPIRQYAFSLLEKSGEADAARDRHARWFADRSHQIAEEMLSPRLVEARNWVLRNQSEFVAAMEWSLQSGQPQIGVSILAAVGRRLANQGSSLLLPTVVDLVKHPALEPSPELVIAMAHTAHLLYLTTDLDGAQRLVDRAETMAGELGDPMTSGVALARKAVIMSVLGQTAEARELLRRAADVQEEAGAVPLMDWVNLSFEASWAGDLDTADAYAHKGLQWEREHVGHTSGDFECALALVALARGDLEKSIDYGRRAALGRMDQGSLLHARNDWFHLAEKLLFANRPEEAAEALEWGLRLGEAVGIHRITATGPRERLAAAAGDMETVLELATEFFQEVLRADGPYSPDVPSFQSLLYGDASDPPRLMSLLLPLTEALMEHGEVDRPCRFAHAAPGLMAQARYQGWEGIGEAKRWGRLADRCGDPTHEIEMTMEQAFEESAGLLGFVVP
jgi:predicted ATPase/DNA-binding SARP family transcriptional activator